MYQQKRGKNDVKTESRNTIFPKYFSSNLLFHAPPFQESNRIERFQAWMDINRVLITVFLFFFFSIVSTRIGAISSIRSLSLFSPPAFNGEKGWKKRRPCFGISSPPPTDYFVNEEGQTCFHARSVCGCACMKFSFQIVPLTLTVYEWPLMKT